MIFSRSARRFFAHNIRSLSGHTAEQAKAEVTRWYYLSLGMVPGFRYILII